MSNDTAAGQLSFEISPIKWRKNGEGTFLFVESKEPGGFTVHCVTESGHYANPTETRVGGKVYPPGRFYQATTSKDGQPHRSKLCESMDEAKDECEIFRLHGRFPE
jgi:hypothetical protein